MSWISKIKDPMQMQGAMKRPDFFEGWYYRMIAPSGESISLIPGYSTASQDPHSFLQYIIANPSITAPSISASVGEKTNILQTAYLRYPIGEFQCSKDPFQIQIGQNKFFHDGIVVQVEKLSLRGRIAFRNLTPIQKSLLSPSIMGWFAYIPWMECYHGVISMTHGLEGHLALGERTIDFTGGKGYLEKDWGTSFPKRYLWIQCNQFKRNHTSLMCSVAEIPFCGTRFQGHIINLVIDGREIRLATYNQTRINLLHQQNNKITVAADHPRWHLEIQARLEREGALKAPQSGHMSRIIKEGLQGTVAIELLDKHSGARIREEGINAGIELVGYQ